MGPKSIKEMISLYLKIYFLLLTLFLLPSCATTEKYESKLQSWVGKNEDELITHWGVPNNTYSLNDGNKLVMYQLNGGSYSTPVGNMFYTENYWCKTTFTIDKTGIIKNWKHEGNYCISE